MFSKAKPKTANEERPKPMAADMNATAAPAASSRRSGAMKSSSVPSIISADVVLKGNVNSSGEVQLDGALEGDIKAFALMVGEKASVKGEIVCDAVTVRGRVEGSIRAKQVALAATAHIVGDILHSSLSVESGAHFEGNCRHSDDPLSESASSDFRKSRPTLAASAMARPAPAPVAEDIPVSRSAANEAPSFLSQNRSPLR